MKTLSLAVIALLFVTSTTLANSAPSPAPAPAPAPTPVPTVGGGVKNPWRAPFKLAVTTEQLKFIGE